MRIDKLTTTFQEALGEAQSLAVTRDNPYIEPAHVLAAMLAQTDGPKALLARAGVNVAKLQAGLDDAMKRLPQVQGGEQVQPGRELGALLQAPRRKRTSGATSSSRARCSSLPLPNRSFRSAHC
jgi:ATPases with chaperone activity, ATP-binding subunit